MFYISISFQLSYRMSYRTLHLVFLNFVQGTGFVTSTMPMISSCCDNAKAIQRELDRLTTEVSRYSLCFAPSNCKVLLQGWKELTPTETKTIEPGSTFEQPFVNRKPMECCRSSKYPRSTLVKNIQLKNEVIRIENAGRRTRWTCRKIRL